ncbi:MAG: DUF1727 domain-containing protein [Actinobacteria bacterium]|nr:DUF1727 domain-containing protein [Actinomycetota bacterium]
MALAGGLGGLSRRFGRGGGTSLPGRVLLALRPNAAAELAKTLPRGCLLVSATNGKTTTTRMVAACLAAGGLRVGTNAAGANLAAGVATSLMEADRSGVDIAVLEVDEFALARIARAIRPRGLLLMNLFRDQLDRYGELEGIADQWAGVLGELPDDSRIVLNADDPLVAELATGWPNVTTFGVEAGTYGLAELPHAADSVRCRRCGHALAYSFVLMAHLGHWSCPSCGAERPEVRLAVEDVELGAGGAHVTFRFPDGDSHAFTLAVPGLHNVVNAAAAAALAFAVGIPAVRIVDALGGVRAAFGRAERMDVDGRDVRLMLAKNPTGTNENIRTVLLDEDDDLHVLMLLEDRAADGRDVSWIWDVDVEPLLPRLASLTVGGSRAADLALRFRYAGLDTARIRVNPAVEDALSAAIAGVPHGGRLYALPTYTAMLDLRARLERRGAVHPFWRDRVTP